VAPGDNGEWRCVVERAWRRGDSRVRSADPVGGRWPLCDGAQLSGSALIWRDSKLWRRSATLSPELGGGEDGSLLLPEHWTHLITSRVSATLPRVPRCSLGRLNLRVVKSSYFSGPMGDGRFDASSSHHPRRSGRGRKPRLSMHCARCESPRKVECCSASSAQMGLVEKEVCVWDRMMPLGESAEVHSHGRTPSNVPSNAPSSTAPSTSGRFSRPSRPVR